MTLDLVELRGMAEIALCDGRARPRSGAEIAAEVAAAPGEVLRLVGSEPLGAERAAEVFRALAGHARPFVVSLSLAALESRALVEEAARAGCVAVLCEREAGLIEALATGLDADPRAWQRMVTALRRVRALGVASRLVLPLGLPQDDEGIFERVLRLCRQALVSVPVVTSARGESALDSHRARMNDETLANGIAWARRRLARHRSIWRRALWPGGALRVAVDGGYRMRRSLHATRPARYTPTMAILRALNRTRTARTKRLVPTTPRREAAASSPRRASLRMRAASDERVRALAIHLEGALDLRGARRLAQRVGQALAAGYQQVTIDVRAIDAVSVEVVTRFVERHGARLSEAAGRVRIENLREKVAALRSQIGDIEALRLLESAAAA